jgi:hypothetical protein
MASQPNWTPEEWILLLDLYSRAGAHPTQESIEHLQSQMLALALSTDRPRRNLAAESGFRTIASIWTQLARVTAYTEGRTGWTPPQNLRRVLNVYPIDSEALQHEASQILSNLPDIDTFREHPKRPNYPSDDAEKLAGFAHDLVELLGDILQTIDQLPMSLVEPNAIAQHHAAWEELQLAAPADTIAVELQNANIARRLSEAALTGAQLTMKVGGFRRWLREWFLARTVRAARGALSWANLILGSLQSALLGPATELLKEYKDATEKLVSEAVVPGGYLPAPAYA